MHRHPIAAKAAVVLSGRTQRDIAAAVGVNPHTFGRVLNGHVPAWPALQQKLAAELGQPEAVLFGEVEQDVEMYVASSRAAQGLPPHVTNAAVLAVVSRALRAADEDALRETA